MPAPVVPSEPHAREVACDAFVEDGLLALDGRAVVVFGVAALADIGGGKLLRIANDDDLAAAGHRADRVPDRDLRGFVENNDIE